MNIGYVPEDGGWTKSGMENVLLLSIPAMVDHMGMAIPKISYKWLYDRTSDSYILVIEVKEKEIPIIFHQSHAGQLLLDADAYSEFTVVIVTEKLEEIDDTTTLLTFPKISLKRNIQAGW